ncbi:hypothetical protein [Micromonospora sp. NPDC003776]
MIVFTAASVRDISVDAATVTGLTWFGQVLWYAEPEREQLVQVDPHSGTAGPTIACPNLRTGLTTIGGYLLCAAGPAHQLRMCDPGSGEIIGEMANPRTGEPITAMETSRDGLWLGYRDELRLHAGADLDVITSIPAPLGVTGLTVTDRYVTWSDLLGEAITVFDTVTRRNVLQIHVDGRPTSLTWDGILLWYYDGAHARLRAIDVPGLASN